MCTVYFQRTSDSDINTQGTFDRKSEGLWGTAPSIESTAGHDKWTRKG